MIHSKIARETKYIELNGKCYCAYCGEELQPYREIDHYDVTEYYCCECEDAQLEIKIQDEIQKHKSAIEGLKSRFPKERYKKITRTTIELVEE